MAFLSPMLVKRDVQKVFRTLAWRLTEVDKPYEAFLLKRKLRDYNPHVLYLDLFLNTHFARNGSFLVIDALDRLDSKDRQLFYTFLRDIARTISRDQPPSRLKIVVLGRPLIATEIFEAGGASAIQHIGITENENVHDIEAYSKLAFTGSRKYNTIKARNGNFLNVLAREVSSAAHGNFECK